MCNVKANKPSVNKLHIQLKLHIMKLIGVLLFILFSPSTFSQGAHYNITGKVIDKNSKLPLPGASVFAQNTTFGVATDANGDFKLKLLNGGYEVVITFTGYQTETIRI